LLLVTVPAGPFMWGPHDRALGHRRRYDKDSFVALWHAMPVHARLVSFMNARLFPAVRMIRRLGSMRDRAFGEAGTDLRPTRGWLNRALAGIYAGELDRLRSALDGR